MLSRIAVVLSGGGARGAYEAGALLAFQDAQVPTHILAATSVGSINAADYAARSQTLVGNGGLITIYDPGTLTSLADGSRQRTPFPGNTIPSGSFDPVAAKTAALRRMSCFIGSATPNPAAASACSPSRRNGTCSNGRSETVLP